MILTMVRMIFQKLLWLIAFVLIIAAAALNTVRVFLPLIQDKKQLVEAIMSAMVHRLVHFQYFSFSWERGSPRIDLQAVTVVNPATAGQVQAEWVIDHLGFSLNVLKSVWHRHVWPVHLVADGVHFSPSEDFQKLGVQRKTLESGRLDLKAFGSAFSWLAQQPSSDLQATRVKIDFKQKQILYFDQMNVQLRNNYLHHDLRVNGFMKMHGASWVDVSGFISAYVPLRPKARVSIALGGRNFQLVDQSDKRTCTVKRWGAKFYVWDAGTQLDFSGPFSVVDIARLTRYVPHHLMSLELQTWLTSALKSGVLTHGVIRWLSESSDPKDSHFYMALAIHRLNLKYSADWPLLQDAHALLVMDHHRMTITASRAKTMDNVLENVRAIIADLRHPVLVITGRALGEIPSALRFLRQTPLKREGFPTKVVASGKILLDLRIEQPLWSGQDEPEVWGHAQLKEGEFLWPSSFFGFKHINGEVDFHNFDFLSKKLSFDFAGQPMRAHFKMQKDASNHPVGVIHLSGQWNMASLLKQYAWPNAAHIKGSADFQGIFKIFSNKHRVLQSQLVSNIDLRNVSFHFPGHAEKRKGRWDRAVFTLQFHEGWWATFRYRDGVTIQASLTRAADAQRRWHFSVNEDPMEVVLDFPWDASSSWKLQFAHADLLQWLSLSKTTLDPRQIPPLLVTCDACRYGSQVLGALTLQTHPLVHGIAIDFLKIKNAVYSLDLTGDTLCQKIVCQTKVSGTLVNKGLGDFLADFHLTRSIREGYGTTHFSLAWPGLPLQPNFRSMAGDISFHYVHGRMVRLSKSAESKLGLERLLTILSMQSLPQNLFSGFTKMSQKGFEFVKLSGALSIKEGVGYSKQITMNGPLGWTSTSGRFDFVNNHYDLLMKVTPNMTASLPIIVGLAGGPLAGVLTWLVNQAVAPTIGAVAQTRYHIGGSMDHPIFTKVKKA